MPSTSSAIEEEYSEDFEDSVPKSDSIEESIVQRVKSSSGSVETKKPKGLSSGKFGVSQLSSGRRSGRHTKEESDSIVEDVIEEDIHDDIIEEESIAKEVSEEASSKKKSLTESSIIKEEYSQDNFDVYDAS